ncbi:hypothetical protein B0H34DRAFT_798357 [Crassisporium funariophilum]|nr:hypothetical protein B0H34DRAFT_798357 [Crassisporium funariophilum]
MNLKRIASDALQSPSKRQRRASFPQTPSASENGYSSPTRSGNANAKTPSSYATPRTPYTPYPLHPSDSPSNPFGRTRTQRLIHTLPPTTSFSKHVALRLQFVRRGVSPRQGGVYRIVQVPLNYTFVHLRCLVEFLFHTPPTHLGKAKGSSRGEGDEHLFEVKSKVTTYSPLYKPGQIKSGMTTVKLSNVRDPCRWRARYGEDEEEEGDELDGELEEVLGELKATEDEAVEGEEEDWRWEDEEDYTLAHVWPGGMELHRGLIYHHSPTTQIHMTVNNTKLPRRRGFSNTPYVFKARGRMHLSPLPLRQPLFYVSSQKNKKSRSKALSPSPARKRVLRTSLGGAVVTKVPEREQDEDTDAEGDTDVEPGGNGNEAFDANHPFFQSGGKILVDDSDDDRFLRNPSSHSLHDSDDEEEATEDADADLDPERWNEPLHAFRQYLERYMGPGPVGDVDMSLGDDDDEGWVDAFDDEEEGDGVVVPVKVKGRDKNREEEEQEDAYSNEGASDGDSEHDRSDSEGSEDDEPEPDTIPNSTPALTRSSFPSSLPPSSPPPYTSIPPTSSPASSSFLSALPYSHEEFMLEHCYGPNTKYVDTPAPPRTRALRMRMERVRRRMERGKRGLGGGRAVSEEGGKEAEEEEAKEAEEETGEGEEGGEEEKTGEKGKKEWVRPVLGEGEVWDPFGDELEV